VDTCTFLGDLRGFIRQHMPDNKHLELWSLATLALRNTYRGLFLDLSPGSSYGVPKGSAVLGVSLSGGRGGGSVDYYEFNPEKGLDISWFIKVTNNGRLLFVPRPVGHETWGKIGRPDRSNPAERVDRVLLQALGLGIIAPDLPERIVILPPCPWYDHDSTKPQKACFFSLARKLVGARISSLSALVSD